MPRSPILSCLLAAGLFLAALALPAQAQGLDCRNPVTQADMNGCAHSEWQMQDAWLNSAYGDAMKLMKDWDADLPEDEQGAADKLREAQRAWITYRDAACAAEGYAMRGGSAEMLLVYGCMTRLTEARAADLQNLYDSYSN